jgi:hypothetical protein
MVEQRHLSGPGVAVVGLAMWTASASQGLAQEEYDSAGVTVVRNPPAEVTLDWTVDPEPLIEIGGAADDARYQLFRVVDAARLSDGRIVVADGSSHELRFYDERGAYVSAVGREGGGPGEFREISGLEVGADDSIYVFDWSSQRVSIFDARGELARDFGVPPAIAPLDYVGRFADERWYARRDGPFDPATSGASRRELVRYIALDAAFERDSPIAELAGEIWVAFRAFGDVGYRTALFTPSPSQDVHRSCLYVVVGDDFDVSVFSSDGRLLRRVRNAGERQPVTEAHRSAWIKDFIDNLPAAVPEALRAQLPNELKKNPTPESLPVYNDVVIDAQGYIWLQEYEPQSESGRSWSESGRWWIVLSPTGELLGRVEMPAALDVYEIGSDYVLGRWQDEILEEFVRMYRLRAHRDSEARPPALCTEAREPRCDQEREP